MARPVPLGTLIKFSAYSILKALGRNTGKSDHEWLHSVLTGLRRNGGYDRPQNGILAV